MLRWREQPHAGPVVLALLLWLGLWAAQALVAWHAQKLLERTLDERLEKLVLCARLVD
ncbi:MAG: hypothetical protein H5T97_00155, partial [Firmicutes bacterium]|nr:hypothetical protein [Bacillota bacterium]